MKSTNTEFPVLAFVDIETTGGNSERDRITEIGIKTLANGQETAYLAADIADALRATLRFCPVLATEPEGRLAAIVDFTFNLGAGRLQASTLRRRVNQRDWPGAAQELRRWIHGGGRVLPGLVLRREAETLLLASGQS